MKKDLSVKWFVSFDDNETCSAGVSIIKADSPKTAIIRIIKRLGYGFFDVEDPKYQNPKNWTMKQLWMRFDDFNGDGCAFVISIINDKGKIIYKCNE